MAMARLTNSTVMLRCAKYDRAATQTNAWITVFMCIIGHSIHDPINVLTYNSQADR